MKLHCKKKDFLTNQAYAIYDAATMLVKNQRFLILPLSDSLTTITESNKNKQLFMFWEYEWYRILGWWIPRVASSCRRISCLKQQKKP